MNWDEGHLRPALNDVCHQGCDQAARWFHAHQELEVVGNPVNMREACRNGAIGILDYLVDTGLESKWHDVCLVGAAVGGHLNVFEWRLNRIRAPLLSMDELVLAAVTFKASGRGRVEVLQWLKDHGLTVPCTENIILAAWKYIAVLQWFKENAAVFSFKSDIVVDQSIGNLNILQWWKQSGFDVDWPRSVCMYKICRRATNTSEVLQWWKESGAGFYNVARATAHLVTTQNIPALEWVKVSGLTITKPEEFQHLDQYLRWWREDQERND
ncbi:hypothetical protein DFJ73DRAFT_863164 [Zopfochytrium polystomum]|nr:hypothetical protein DFJ73DRAFT_863164 [Zopfochytrium polystomum]